jgi:serine/threonine protein kinase
MLLGLREYGAGVDMWAAGCVWAEMLVGEPLFTGQSGIDQLFKIFRVCGSPDTVIWPGLERLPHYQKDLFPEWRKVCTFTPFSSL